MKKRIYLTKDNSNLIIKHFWRQGYHKSTYHQFFLGNKYEFPNRTRISKISFPNAKRLKISWGDTTYYEDFSKYIFWYDNFWIQNRYFWIDETDDDSTINAKIQQVPKKYLLSKIYKYALAHLLSNQLCGIQFKNLETGSYAQIVTYQHNEQFHSASYGEVTIDLGNVIEFEYNLPPK